jgi:protein SCO1
VKRSFFFFALIIVLILPVTCFIWVWQKGGNGRVKMPKYYGKVMGTQMIKVRGDEVLDTIWQQVKMIPLKNQFGDSVDLEQFAPNKIVLMNFFFTSCKTVCPTLNGNMKFLLRRYKKNDSLIRFVSISVDEQRDSVRQLRRYGDGLQVDFDKWWFCNGKAKDVKRFMFSELQIPDIQAKDTLDEGFNHSNYWVLLDKERNIRGYYAALDTFEMRRCADDISLLILEKKRNQANKKNKLDVSAFTQPKRN